MKIDAAGAVPIKQRIEVAVDRERSEAAGDGSAGRKCRGAKRREIRGVVHAVESEKTRFVPFIVGLRRRSEAAAENRLEEAGVEREGFVRAVDVFRRANDDLPADIGEQGVAMGEG